LKKFRRLLSAEDFSGADSIVAEWRAISGATGHSIQDIEFVSMNVDSAGRPLEPDASNAFTELDGKLRSGDILEVKSGQTAQNVIEQYFDSGQYSRHSQLLSVYGGKEIKLYVASSGRAEIEGYLTANGIANVKVYAIP